MRRKLFTLAAGFSAVLFIAIGVLWVRSYRSLDAWSWSDGRRVPTAGYQIAWRKILLTRDGRVHFIMDRNMGGSAYRRRLEPEAAKAAYQLHYRDAAASANPGRRLLGFEYVTHEGYPLIASVMRGPPVELTRVWTVPLWFPAALTVVLPAWWLAAWQRRRRRASRGLCHQCGYDLRASQDRCPECGATVVAGVKAGP